MKPGVTPDAAMLAFARAHDLLAPDEDGAWVPLTGGVSSDIWHLASSRGQACIKRALAQLKVAATWEAPVDRNAYEWAYMAVADAIAPGAVPRPIAHDESLGLFAMAWLAPDAHALWKTELLAGRIDPDFAAQVGELIGRIHAGTARDPAIPLAFATDANFHALRIEPYLLATASAHPDLAPAIHAATNALAGTHRALVHGDVSPKNLLVGPDGPVLLDAECAWFGDPAFDLAFCLNHLAIKARVVAGAAEALRIAFDRLADAYLAQVDWEARDALERRAACLLPMLALARVDGKSPVEYLDEVQRTELRQAARAAIQATPTTLAAARAVLLS